MNTNVFANGNTNDRKILIIKIILIIFICFAILDFAYKTINNINTADRKRCIVYSMLPGSWFILFENLVELPVIIFLSIFTGLFLQSLLFRLRFDILGGPFRTFILASLLPICACSSVSFISPMEKKLKMRNAIIFLMAAPLLNPFIMVLSFNVLGMEYCLARIIGTFVLAFSAGYLIHLFQPNIELKAGNGLECAGKGTCTEGNINLYIKGIWIAKRMIPFVLIGAGLSIVFQFFLGNPVDVLKGILQSFTSRVGVILLGIPLYVCGGADILILKPLVHAGLPLGSALSFSLTASSVCITSLLMIGRLLGKKIVLILTVYLAVFSFAYGELINLIL